jgi:hypothetical protein
MLPIPGVCSELKVLTITPLHGEEDPLIELDDARLFSLTGSVQECHTTNLRDVCHISMM